MSRPPWVPDDIEDEYVEQYADTLGGHLARIAHEAKSLGAVGVSAQVDQVSALIRDRRDAGIARYLQS